MNNYQEGCQDGWDLRTKSVGYADACYFKGGKAPILPDGGGVVNINSNPAYGVVYDNCTRRITGHGGITEINCTKLDKEFPASQYATGTWVPTDTWADYYVNNHDKVMDVPEICAKYSGAGKIVIWDAYTSSIPEADATKFQEACATQLTAAVYDENGNKISGVAGGGSETDAGGESEVLFKLQISSSASDLSISKASDVNDIASYCSTLTGGTAKVGLRADASSAQKVIGADSSERHIRTPKNDIYLMITLDKALAAGDVITFTGKGTATNEICFMADNTYSATEATSGRTYTVTSESPLVGKNVIYVSRAQASNTYINMITIMRPDQTGDQEETPTGINTIDNTSAPLQMKVRKIMEDGRIVIEKNGNKYTTTGIKI